MNFFTFLVPLILVGSYFLDTIVDLANLSHLTTTLPQEFKNFYSSKKYQRSQQYLKENTHFGLIKATLLLPAILAFIFLGGFNAIDLFARQFNQGEIITGLIFTLILLGFNTLISLPFSIYHIFVLEEKYGFNKTTPKTFTLDSFKSLALTIIITAPILALIIWLFSSAGNFAWVYAWVIVSLIQIVLMFIAPIIIMPIFNKFTPLKKGPLKTEIEKFAQAQKFKIQGIFTMDGSKRSTKANAFFTGFGRFKRIVLFDTLIKNHSVPELVAVLAHEIGHYQKKHILQMLAISIATTALSFFLFSLLINNSLLFDTFQMEHLSIYASLIFIGIIYSPIMEIIGLATNALSRRNEYQADRFAVTTYTHKKDFITALKKLTVSSLGNLNPHPLKVFIDYSHPPILQRIHAIKRLK